MAEAASTPPAAPWLEAPALALAAVILRSHARGFGRPLLTPAIQAAAGPGGFLEPQGPRGPENLVLAAQELFAASTVVLAHDGGPDPRLIYANRAALRLWRRPWAAMVGLPSRLTAEPAERAGRAQMLSQAQRQHALGGYTGIRIDSHGRRFQIRGARLWTLWNAAGEPCGQAAAFSDWHWLA
ncbi:MEKHLA domain-containing protein [Synechococcus sp. GreenBA-s]|nr:MEKHLA domain-containing protein [Synechococcus sp. GreenBA-s]